MKKTFKKVISLIAIAITISVFTCCDSETSEDATKEFITIQQYSTFAVIVHTPTGVMYAISASSASRGVVTVLVDADGRPLIYNSTNDNPPGQAGRK